MGTPLKDNPTFKGISLKNEQGLKMVDTLLRSQTNPDLRQSLHRQIIMEEHEPIEPRENGYLDKNR